MGIFIEKSRGERTGDASTILFPNYMESVQKQERIQKAAHLKAGDFVSWNSSGGRARGKVVRVVRDGKINVPDSSFTINGTGDDPAVLIQLYRAGKETDVRVGHKMSTLTQIESMEKAEPTMNTVHVDSVMGGKKKKKKKAMDANGMEIEIELEEDEMEDEEEDVEMAMGGYGYDMSEKPKKKVTKHAMHDQSTHGNWAGGGGSSSGGSSGSGSKSLDSLSTKGQSLKDKLNKLDTKNLSDFDIKIKNRALRFIDRANSHIEDAKRQSAGPRKTSLVRAQDAFANAYEELEDGENNQLSDFAETTVDLERLIGSKLD